MHVFELLFIFRIGKTADGVSRRNGLRFIWIIEGSQNFGGLSFDAEALAVTLGVNGKSRGARSV